MNKKLSRHALSKLCGDMEPDTFVALQASIASEGVRDPIQVFEGQILDGWHRYMAADGLGIECPIVEFAGTIEDAFSLVWREHFTRRNWTASQRAFHIVEFNAARDMMLGRGQRKGEPGSSLTNEDMAEVAQVTPRTVRMARAVLSKASDAVKDAVRDGVVSVKKAASVVRLPKPKQEKALDDPKGPWKAATPIPKPQVGASKEAYDELEEKRSTLAEEVDRLTDRLAVMAIEGASEEERGMYAQTLAELRHESKVMTAELRAVRATRDSLLQENKELKNEVVKMRNQLTKFRHAA